MASAKVAAALSQLAVGNWSNVKSVRAGVFERKIDAGPGYRVYFGKDGDRLVILLGGSTKQRQPQAIETAKECWADYRRRKSSKKTERNVEEFMALTREFKNTVAARVQRDPRFREALFTEALNAYFAGDTTVGKAILRDFVNATVGFEELAVTLNKPSKSLHRMLAPRGNPSTENFFSIVTALQKKAHVKLRVTAKAS